MSRSETVAGERLTEGERGTFKFAIIMVYAFSSTLLRREPPPGRSLKVHSVGILPSEKMEHSIRASSVICAHIISSGKHEPQRDGGTASRDGMRARKHKSDITLSNAFSLLLFHL